MKNKVVCCLCGGSFGRITHLHLRRHKVTVQEYREMFPDAPLVSEAGRQNGGTFKKGYDERRVKTQFKEGYDYRRMPFTGKDGKHYVVNTGKTRFKKGIPIREQIGEEAHLQARKNASKTKRELFAKGLLNPPYPKPYYVPELGHSVRSSWEEKVALLLQAGGITYEYEGKRFKLSDGTTYMPDFIIGNVVVEVKGFLPENQRRKYRKFYKEYPQYTYIIVGTYDEKICDIGVSWNKKEILVNILKDKNLLFKSEKIYQHTLEETQVEK